MGASAPSPADRSESAALDAGPGSIPELRAAVLSHLRRQGFHIPDSERGLLMPVENDKEALRTLHLEAVVAQRERSRAGLEKLEATFTKRLLNGADLDPGRIRPSLRLLPPGDHMDAKLWRWTSLHWSIPVSSGYGRRMRFLVVDEGHGDALMGLIGLADPVFALTARDGFLEWDKDGRRERLTNVMDAFVLGSVPPYSRLLGGKLVASLLGSTELRVAFEGRYSGRTSRIMSRTAEAQLAMVTTTSALGRSSVYNRLKRRDGSYALEAVGYTRGTGDFQFSGSIYDQLNKVAHDTLGEGATHRHPNWGSGFRNRREVVQRALKRLGLSPTNFRMHGVQRQVFVTETAHNSREWLRTGVGQLTWRSESTREISEWWSERWAKPRAKTQGDWRQFERTSWTLWDSPDQEVNNGGSGAMARALYLRDAQP